MKKMFNFLIFILCLIEALNANILSEDDIIKYLAKSNTEAVLNIDSEIEFTKEFKEITINKNIKKISLIGSSLDSAKLNLKYPLYFDSNVEEIEIKKININGNLLFKKINKKITIDTVNLNGYIDSDFDKNSNNAIEITNLNYNPTGKLVENCIDLSGNIKITGSNFHGNSSCGNRLFYYNGFETYKFDIKKSNFDGEYQCPFLNIENAVNATIQSSRFEKGYSSRNIGGGTGIRATFSSVNINDCIFNDILSFNEGGAFNFYNTYYVEGSNLKFNNVTSLGLGSIFQIFSSNLYPSRFLFSNIIQQNTGIKIKNMRDGGLIMNIEGNAEAEIITYHAENLINDEASASAFILSNNVKLTVRNMYINNLKGNGEEGGLFYTSKDSFNINFSGYNITLNNLYQLNKSETSIIYIDKNNFPSFDDLKVFNSGGYNTNFITVINNSIITLTNLKVDNFESKTIREFIGINSDIVYYREGGGMATMVNMITTCKITNVISRGVLFRVKNGVFNIMNCEFSNIHECYKYNNCTHISTEKKYVEEAEIMIAYGDYQGGIYFTSSKFNKIYGEKGNMIYNAKLSLSSCEIYNSYFKEGFYYFDERDQKGGFPSFTSNVFENNTSEVGTIFNVPYFLKLTGNSGGGVSVKTCTFTNNTASKFGGVIYSGENAERLSFPGCTFNNNHAGSGNIVYGFSTKAFPGFDFPLTSDIASTIPSKFVIDKDSKAKAKDIYIYSGNKIPEGIKYRLYDGYNNQMYFPQESSDIQFDDLILFNVEVNDTYNAVLEGQTQNYCWGEFCEFPPVKVIGNPGIYTVSLKFKSFGIYQNFAQDSIDIEVEIGICNEKVRLNQAIGNTYLKTCYIPQCEFDCNDGKCINNDLCDCTQAKLKGKYCNEYIKLERINALDSLFIVIAFIMIFIIVIVIVMTFLFKNNPAIKGGGFEFLIIILIGLLINVINVIFLTYTKTTQLCYQTYLFTNTGFAFVFGSIFVKSYRIYKIFCRERKSFDIGFKTSTMYLIIVLMALFHWIMAILWLVFKSVNAVNDYTTDNKEFIRCEYPLSKHISTLFNFIILMLEFILSYSIRKVEKKFQEALAIPAYVYIIYMLLMIIVGNQKEIDVVMKDYFDIGGTIINTIVSVYDLFIIKFIEIYTVHKEDSSQRTFVRVM